MKSLGRALGNTLAALTVVTSCYTGGPADDLEAATGGRGASEGGRSASAGGRAASEGGRAASQGGAAAQSSGGSRPAGTGGRSGGNGPGGEPGDSGGFPGEDPSAGASGDVDSNGGTSNGGTSAGGSSTGGASNGGTSTGGNPTGGTSTGGAATGGASPVEGCDSGRFWDPAGSDGLPPEGPWMNPGRACITCHQEETGGKVVEIGGTVYPSLDQQDLCYGVDGTSINAEVVVTDNEGEVFRLPIGPTGNFSLLLDGAERVQLPVSAKVVYAGRERVMTYHPNVADCNYCHTREGRNDAPGRIFLP